MRYAFLVILFVLLATRGVTADPPAQATAAFSRAQVAMAGHDCEEALRLLDEAIAAAPSYWEAHRAMGECFLKLNKPDEARPHLEAALRLSPGDATTKAMLTRALDLQKSEAEQMARAIQARDRLVKQPPERPVNQPRPLGDHARARPSPAAPSPLPVDATRERAVSIFRPRMVAIAPTYRALVAADRRYRNVCGEPGQTSDPTRPGRYEVKEYTSETAWGRRFVGDAVQGSVDTPTCRTLAADIRALSAKVAAAMDGVDGRLASPPPVNPTTTEVVFAQLASELW
jgi:tetratricopeptide (TPR) repeat protein